jgi:hypothetical protein
VSAWTRSAVDDLIESPRANPRRLVPEGHTGGNPPGPIEPPGIPQPEDGCASTGRLAGGKAEGVGVDVLAKPETYIDSPRAVA